MALSAFQRRQSILKEYLGTFGMNRLKDLTDLQNIAIKLKRNNDWKGYNATFSKKLKKQSALGQLRLLIAAIKEQLASISRPKKYDFFDREAVPESEFIGRFYPL